MFVQSLVLRYIAFLTIPLVLALGSACAEEGSSLDSGSDRSPDSGHDGSGLNDGGSPMQAGDGGTRGDASAIAQDSAVPREAGSLGDASMLPNMGEAGASLGPAPVLLGAAGQYAILAKAGISNVPTSKITGKIGVSPMKATAITGFALTKAGTYWTSPEITDGAFAADNDPPTPTDLTTAVSDMETAYTDAAGRPTPTVLNLGGGAIGGQTLAPGLYKFTSTVTIPSDLTLKGPSNAVWIFQITGDLMLSAAQKVTLTDGAQAKNVFWQVAGTVDLGTTAHIEGNVMSMTAIKLAMGSSVNGRLFAQTAVTIASATITAPP